MPFLHPVKYITFAGTGLKGVQECSYFITPWDNLAEEGDREEPANYRGITLLSVAGKVFCKILNN